MLIHHKEIYTLDNSQKEDDVIKSHPHEQDKNENVAKACQKHGHDEKSCSMNTPETGYYETEVAEVVDLDDKELRQRFIILAETIQQDLEIEIASRHRKIEDVTRYPEVTALNKYKSNDINNEEKKQLSAVTLSDSYQNVVFVEIIGAICSLLTLYETKSLSMEIIHTYIHISKSLYRE